MPDQSGILSRRVLTRLSPKGTLTRRRRKKASVSLNSNGRFFFFVDKNQKKGVNRRDASSAQKKNTRKQDTVNITRKKKANFPSSLRLFAQLSLERGSSPRPSVFRGISYTGFFFHLVA